MKIFMVMTIMAPLRTFNNARRQKLMIKILKTGKLLEKNLVSTRWVKHCVLSNTMYTTYFDV